MQQLACSREQMDGIAAALTPDQLVGASAQERAARTELAGDALQLLDDAVAAVDSGEGEDVLLALVSAIDGLAVQLRDRVLDGVVASSPPPDCWPT
ncbi:hypothetical protein ACH4TV_42770 [Streptomyces sp. NPDC020898]|uniref:hypothetical protein n=1 Tax=Streptomyces sp. NPDC020898 TaxID=3365101 RepID=UPI0037A53FD0